MALLNTGLLLCCSMLLVGPTMSFNVKGSLQCNSVPVKNQIAKLYHNLDDEMAKVALDRDATDRSGEFELVVPIARANSDLAVVIGEGGCDRILKVRISGVVQRDSQVIDVGSQNFCCKRDASDSGRSGLQVGTHRGGAGSGRMDDRWNFQVAGKVACNGRPARGVTAELHHKTRGEDAPPSDKALRSVRTAFDGMYSLSSVSKPSHGVGMLIVMRATSPNGRRQCWATVGYGYMDRTYGVRDAGDTNLCCEDEKASSSSSGDYRRPSAVQTSSDNQFFGVRAKVQCSGRPLNSVKVTLYMRHVDPSRNAERELDLGSTKTNSQGQFEISATPSTRLNSEGLKPFIELTIQEGQRICEKQIIFPASMVGRPMHVKPDPIDFCCS